MNNLLYTVWMKFLSEFIKFFFNFYLRNYKYIIAYIGEKLYEFWPFPSLKQYVIFKSIFYALALYLIYNRLFQSVDLNLI